MSASDQRTMRLPSLERACSACGKSVPADSRFCPSCGAAMESVPASAAKRLSSADAAVALLSEANLLRVREDWTGAESRCLDVLRLDPNNLEAHTLLGDIYRDQRRMDDAAQWYQLALDLDPTNASVRAKLTGVEEEEARKLVGAILSGSDRHAPSGTQRLAGLPPSMWIQGLWGLFAVFIIIATILIVGLRGRQGAKSETATRVTRAAGPVGTVRKGMGKFVLPAQRTPASSGSHAPIAPPLSAGDVAPDQPVVASPAPSQSQLPVQPGSQDSAVTSFNLAPGQDRAAVVLTERQAAGESVELLRQRTMQNAYRAAYSLFGSNAALQTLGVTVRFGASGPLVFTGVVDRSAIERISDAGDNAQILAAFTNVAWNPNLFSEGPREGEQAQGASGDSGEPQPQ